MKNYDKLQATLREIFEMDKADLDFGIYRIMNQKRDEVNKFINDKLPKEINDILSKTITRDKLTIENELSDLANKLDVLGMVKEDSPKYLELERRLAEATDITALESEVFSHLSNFFKRYYKDGDFISMRRYKKDVYAIPYEGEEVKLHWANHDQYYIKTSEYLKNYSFKLGTKPEGEDTRKTVHFRLKEASTEQNNNKSQDGERRFAIYDDMPVEVEDGMLYINFTYEVYKKSIKQNDLEAQAVKVIEENIPVEFASICEAGSAATEKNKKRTLLEKHIGDFISRNTFDYFIHKDLGAFLNRELDFYIKNEVLYLDDIDTENTEFFVAHLSKMKAIKSVAQKVISFLAQVEDFQKKLWLKKKFVVRTDYCITLDKIPEVYYPEIANNEAQLAEWRQLFDVTIHSVEELHFEPYLVLDTKFFSEEFKDKLLGEFDNLDEETDGVLINSENFQALNLMQEKYREKVDTIYIDPPYNTGNDGFNYKDGFSHSSWLSLIENRMSISKKLLTDKGVFFSSIDDKEADNLRLISNEIFQPDNFINIITVKTKIGGVSGSSEGKSLRDSTEFVYAFANNKDKVELNPTYIRTPLYQHIKNYLSTGKSWKYTSVLISLKDKVLIKEDIVKGISFYGYKTLETKSVLQFAKDFGITEEEVYNNYAHKIIRTTNAQSSIRATVMKETMNYSFPVYSCVYTPIKGRNTNKEIEVLYTGENRNMVMFLTDVVENVDGSYFYLERVNTLWDDIEYNNLTKEGNIEFSNGKKPLKMIERIIKLNTQEDSVILDYFAGSGTTGHATININQEDKGKRKYLLVEMGQYFDSITKPRLMNSLYSKSWANGKPQDKQGISQMFKYQVLESYEDTLNNLELKQSDSLLQFAENAQENYLLNYMLDMESRDHLFDINIFKNPFDYKLKVTENNELIPTRIDLVETFNYLIGLYVERIQRQGDIKFVEGTTREGKKTLIVWRNTETVDNSEVQRVFRKLYESVLTHEFEQIYINGDHHFQNYRVEEDVFKVKLIEEEFFKRMFEE